MNLAPKGLNRVINLAKLYGDLLPWKKVKIIGFTWTIRNSSLSIFLICLVLIRIVYQKDYFVYSFPKL
jgi:hypothetical protein